MCLANNFLNTFLINYFLNNLFYICCKVDKKEHACLSKKNLLPLFTNGVQLPQAITKSSLLFTTKSPKIAVVCFINFGRIKAESTNTLLQSHNQLQNKNIHITFFISSLPYDKCSNSHHQARYLDAENLG